MDKEKEEVVFRRRIQDLATLAQRRGCILYSDFLNLYEQNILCDLTQKFSWIQGKTFGGYEGAERRMAAFFPPGWDEEPEWPIACIRIRPRQEKFAEELSHRDILGAMMHLGIERGRLGDIAVKGQDAYLFCAASLAPMICDEVTRIRRTSVFCAVCEEEGFTYEPSLEPVTGSVASVRLDAVMALAFSASRSSLLSLIEGGSVFVNGKLITSNAYALKEDDLVSVRGHGRFLYRGCNGQSRKGRTWIRLDRYV